MQEIQKVNLLTSFLPQHLYRVNLISENHLLKGMLISYCYGNQIGHYLFYFLVYDGWLKWNTSTWQRQKRRWSSCLSSKRHTRQTSRNSYEKLESKYTKKKEKLKSYKTQTNFCTELYKKQNKKYYKRVYLINVTDCMTARRSGKLLKHFSYIRVQFSWKCDY